MLTGMIKPSQGDAIIFGRSLLQETTEVRRSLGLCQQFDVLFDELSVEDHLYLVCDLKDIPYDVVESEIYTVLEEVMLTEHRKKRA